MWRQMNKPVSSEVDSFEELTRRPIRRAIGTGYDCRRQRVSVSANRRYDVTAKGFLSPNRRTYRRPRVKITRSETSSFYPRDRLRPRDRRSLSIFILCADATTITRFQRVIYTRTILSLSLLLCKAIDRGLRRPRVRGIRSKNGRLIVGGLFLAGKRENTRNRVSRVRHVRVCA